MNKLIFAAIILLLGLLQATILDAFKFFWVKPDLLLASVVIASLSLELRWSLAAASLAGFLKDITGVHSFGIYTLLFPLWSFLIIRLSKQITLDNDFLPPVLVSLTVLLNSIIVRALSLTLGNPVASIGIFLRVTFIESLYTALIFPLLFKIVKPVFYGVGKYKTLS